MKKNFLVILATLATLVAITTSCSRSSNSTTSDDEGVTDSNQNTAEQAYSVAGGVGGTTEGGSVALLNENMDQTFDVIESSTTIEQQSVNPFAACSYTSNRSCTGANCTIAWASCTIGTATMTGGWSEVYSSGACASTFATTCSVTRTSATSGSVATFASGATLTTTSDSHQAYDGTTVSGGQTSTNSSGTRSIAINGVRRVLKGPRGRTWFDHSIQTTTNLSMTGARSSGNRTISSGVLRIFHNRASFTATNTFSSVVWGNSACCYPTSGTISTTLTGSTTGTTSLAFTSTCGTANFTDTTGATSSVSLSYCE
jgi:hypothetical protein